MERYMAPRPPGQGLSMRTACDEFASDGDQRTVCDEQGESRKDRQGCVERPVTDPSSHGDSNLANADRVRRLETPQPYDAQGMAEGRHTTACLATKPGARGSL